MCAMSIQVCVHVSVHVLLFVVFFFRWSLLVCYFIPDKNCKSQLASTPRQRKHTKGRARATKQPPNNSDLSNLSPTSLPVDDFEPEKEVCEEKEDPLAVGRKEGGGRQRKEERGRSKQRMSLEARGTSAQEETSSRVQTPVKRGRASMPVRVYERGRSGCMVYVDLQVHHYPRQYRIVPRPLSTSRIFFYRLQFANVEVESLGDL